MYSDQPKLDGYRQHKIHHDNNDPVDKQRAWDTGASISVVDSDAIYWNRQAQVGESMKNASTITLERDSLDTRICFYIVKIR